MLNISNKRTDQRTLGGKGVVGVVENFVSCHEMCLDDLLLGLRGNMQRFQLMVNSTQ